ncbi:hypothetical protein F5Y12DRAFT_3271 [Xylaria sp. FL1777]|nr:hypothetical protein F5Y12DRAFT_3271 [Xylaria sp. FL1777]
MKMLYNKKALLSAAALTGTSLAQSTTITTTTTAAGEANDLACTRSYISLLAGAPTPTGPLGSAITSYANGAVPSVTGAGNGNANADPQALLTQVCDFSAQLPSSLQSQFDDYATSLISYVSASSSAIDAVITNCVATGSAASEAAAYTSFVNSFATHTGPLCAAATVTTTTSGFGNGTATSTGSSTGTGTGGSSSGGESSTTTTVVTGGGAGGSGTTTTGAGSGGASSSSTVPTGAAAMPTAVFGSAAFAGLLAVILL